MRRRSFALSSAQLGQFSTFVDTHAPSHLRFRAARGVGGMPALEKREALAPPPSPASSVSYDVQPSTDSTTSKARLSPRRAARSSLSGRSLAAPSEADIMRQTRHKDSRTLRQRGRCREPLQSRCQLAEECRHIPRLTATNGVNMNMRATPHPMLCRHQVRRHRAGQATTQLWLENA